MDAVDYGYGQYRIVTIEGPSLLVDSSASDYNPGMVTDTVQLLLKSFRERLDYTGANVLDKSGQIHKETLYNVGPYTDKITVSFKVLEKIND